MVQLLKLVQLVKWCNYWNGAIIEMVQLLKWCNYWNGAIIEMVQLLKLDHTEVDENGMLAECQLFEQFLIRHGRVVQLCTDRIGIMLSMLFHQQLPDVATLPSRHTLSMIEQI